MDTKGGKQQGGGGGGVMSWAIGIDLYTLMCIKLMTNKNLLYKKINLKKFKNPKIKKKKSGKKKTTNSPPDTKYSKGVPFLSLPGISSSSPGQQETSSNSL